MRGRPAHKDATIIARGGEVLAQMDDLCNSLVYAALVTDDGFEIAHLGGTRADGRFASMASSIQALSEAVARELTIGAGQYVILAAERGYVIQLRVPGHEIVLGALFGNEETLGKALAISRISAEKMSAHLASAS
jgi:predicted regulator of Ras-like GTPase activity (Roadblock/LC7/MglB family)